MNTHVVTRRLPKGRETLAPGTEVDASRWRNARQLEEQRYIKPLTGSEPAGDTQPDERREARGKEGKR